MDLVFAGVLTSLVVEWAKRKFGTTRYATIAICAVLSLVCGSAYAVLTYYGVLEQALKVFTIAGAFYAFIIKSVTD